MGELFSDVGYNQPFRIDTKHWGLIGAYRIGVVPGEKTMYVKVPMENEFFVDILRNLIIVNEEAVTVKVDVMNEEWVIYFG